MYLEWEDGHKQPVNIRQLVVGLMRKNKRPIKVYYSKYELEDNHEHVTKQNIDWFNRCIVNCLDPFKKEIIEGRHETP